MKTIAKYLIELQKELKKMHGDLISLEEYRSHLSESFIAFKKKKESNYFGDQELEDLFVEQLEPVKIIAKSLVGLEGDVPTTTKEISIQTKLKSDIRQLIGDFKESDGNKILKLKEFYLRYRSPPTNAFVYLLYFIVFWIGGLLAIFILPDINYISCNGGPSFIHIGSINSVTCPNSQINGIYQGGFISESPFLIPLVGLIIVSLIYILLIRFGYKNDKKYSIMTGICLGLFLIPISITQEISFFINSQVSDFNLTNSPDYLIHSWQWVSDWNLINTLSLQSIATVFLYFMIRLFILILGIILFPILIGILLKLAITNLKILNSQKIKNISIISMMLIINVSLILIIPSLTYPIPAYNMPSPINDNSPLYYSVNPSSTVNSYSAFGGPAGSFNTTFPSNLGKISFELSTSLNISIDRQSFKTKLPNFKGCVTQFQEQCQINQVQSLLGTYYYPTNDSSNYLPTLNTSYPFLGYKASLDQNLTSIEWETNIPYILTDNSAKKIDVTTITYTSETNKSEFTFSFDKQNGFLLKADLTLDNGSWDTNLDMNVLTISRIFILNKINDPNYFSSVSILQLATTGAMFLLCYGFLIIYIIYYEKKFLKKS